VNAMTYEIRVAGVVPADQDSEFPGMRVLRMHGETRVSGHVADQAALHGVIDRLESLGLRLLEVSQRDEGDDRDA
jgi:hypothetical protein